MQPREIGQLGTDDEETRYNNMRQIGNIALFTSFGLFILLPDFLMGIPCFLTIIAVLMISTSKKELGKLNNVSQFTVVQAGPNTNLTNPLMQVINPQKIQPNTTFHGVWDSEWGEIKLIKNGIDVVGNFIGADLQGHVTGRKFFFDWVKADENLSGRGVLTIENGLLIGSWGHGESRDNGGPIKGTPQKEEPKLVVNEPIKTSSLEETTTSEIPVTQVETIVKEEPKEIDKIEQIKQAAQEKKEEVSEQIKEKMEEVEEKLPEEIKETESFQEMKSTVEDTIENLEEKTEQVIEDVAVESTEQMEQVQEKILLSLEDSLSKLNDTLERLDKAVMSKDRENIISELSGSQMNLNMTVDRIDNTIGYGIDEALRGGKTIVGNIEGIPHPVSIKVPKSMNDFASGLKKGQKIEQPATLSSFNSIRKMLEFVLN